MSIFGGVLYLEVDEIKQVYVFIWRGALFRSRRDKTGKCLCLEGALFRSSRDKAGICLYLDGCSI
jgi:hypothetical protein